MIPKEAPDSTTCCTLDLHHSSETPMQSIQSFRLYTCDTDCLGHPQIRIRVSGLPQSQQTTTDLHVLDVELLVQAFSEVVGLAEVPIE